MKPKSNGRIPMFIESERGDDKMGTDPSGALITDHNAEVAGVSFTPGVPQENIKEAVEGQLRDDKWVIIEKGDGKTELLTKKDLPKKEDTVVAEEVPEEVVELHAEGTGAGNETKTTEKPAADDWRNSFGTPPEPKAVAAARNAAGAAAATAKPKAAPVIKAGMRAAKTTTPSKPVENWKSKFEDIKSATSVHKGKAG